MEKAKKDQKKKKEELETWKEDHEKGKDLAKEEGNVENGKKKADVEQN